MQTIQDEIKRKYKNAEQIKAEFQICEMTLWRWMRRPVNPFPPPYIGSNRSKRLWKTADIEAWEQREAQIVLDSMNWAMRNI